MPVAALAIVLPLASCGEGDATATPTEGVAVDQRLEFSLPQATIRVPDRLVAIDFSRFDEEVVRDLETRVGGEPGRRLGQQVRAIAAQGLLQFCAFDPSTPGDGFAENVNVIIAPLSPGMDRAGMLAANLAQFGQNGITVLSTDVFAAGDLECDRFRLRMERAGTDGVAYLLVHDGQVHTVTFTAGPSSSEAFFADGESIMRDYRPR